MISLPYILWLIVINFIFSHSNLHKVIFDSLPSFTSTVLELKFYCKFVDIMWRGARCKNNTSWCWVFAKKTQIEAGKGNHLLIIVYQYWVSNAGNDYSLFLYNKCIYTNISKSKNISTRCTLHSTTQLLSAMLRWGRLLLLPWGCCWSLGPCPWPLIISSWFQSCHF